MSSFLSQITSLLAPIKSLSGFLYKIYDPGITVSISEDGKLKIKNVTGNTVFLKSLVDFHDDIEPSNLDLSDFNCKFDLNIGDSKEFKLPDNSLDKKHQFTLIICNQDNVGLKKMKIELSWDMVSKINFGNVKRSNREFKYQLKRKFYGFSYLIETGKFYLETVTLTINQREK